MDLCEQQIRSQLGVLKGCFADRNNSFSNVNRRSIEDEIDQKSELSALSPLGLNTDYFQITEGS